MTETIVILAGGMSSRMKTSEHTELENEKVEQAKSKEIAKNVLIISHVQIAQ